ncbi:hypothetical protein MM236_04980 [Belliella sp. DSM 107340]|uniref:Transposase DDE domain-containing protein n=1 Tax=Belliella calami TaxID=2923436 RepID=A0ABS9UM53_9BACT|nr:hypothetical protein [Belliella calami]MCH7397328.1 hypothetical protein [Belliella calami]
MLGITKTISVRLGIKLHIGLETPCFVMRHIKLRRGIYHDVNSYINDLANRKLARLLVFQYQLKKNGFGGEKQLH